MVLESKYVKDSETGVEFAPITTPNAVRYPNGDTLDDVLADMKSAINSKEDRMTIVSTPAIISNTLAAEIGQYYILSNVGNLTINLPTPTSGKVETIVFFADINASGPPAFSTSETVYTSGDTLEASKIYEINALWNGAAWCIAATELTVAV